VKKERLEVNSRLNGINKERLNGRKRIGTSAGEGKSPITR